MTQATSNIVVHGHYLIDGATGEILGMATEPTFKVGDRSSAEWVMERLTEAEAELAAIAARRKVLLDNLAGMEAEAQRRADWLRYRFGAELEAWAAAELEGKKQRSIKTPFGTLAFRKKAAKVVVTDEEAAVTYLEDLGLTDAVKVTKKVLLSVLNNSTGAVAYLAQEKPPGITVEPESDGFTIKTGLL